MPRRVCVKNVKQKICMWCVCACVCLLHSIFVWSWVTGFTSTTAASIQLWRSIGVYLGKLLDHLFTWLDWQLLDYAKDHNLFGYQHVSSIFVEERLVRRGVVVGGNKQLSHIYVSVTRYRQHPKRFGGIHRNRFAFNCLPGYCAIANSLRRNVANNARNSFWSIKLQSGLAKPSPYGLFCLGLLFQPVRSDLMPKVIFMANKLLLLWFIVRCACFPLNESL